MFIKGQLQAQCGAKLWTSAGCPLPSLQGAASPSRVRADDKYILTQIIGDIPVWVHAVKKKSRDRENL